MKVLLKIFPLGEKPIYKMCSEREAEELLEDYRSIGWDVRVIGEAVGDEAGGLLIA